MAAPTAGTLDARGDTTEAGLRHVTGSRGSLTVSAVNLFNGDPSTADTT
jgi:hypothetical protein